MEEQTKKRTIVFYTKDDIDIIKSELEKGKKPNKLAEELSVTWNRPIAGVYCKIASIKRGMNVGILPPKRPYRHNPLFYSPSDMKKIVEALRTDESLNEIASRLSKELGRSFKGVYNKIRSMRKYHPNLRKSVKAKPLSEVTIPEGFVLSGKAFKVILHSDRFEIFF